MQTNERKQLLEDALARVTSCDDKRGAPEDSFKVIAAMWSAYLGHEVTPHDVAACMALLKVARIKTSPGDRDSWLDLAGYAACGSACAVNEGHLLRLYGPPDGVLIRKDGDPLNPFDRVG